MVTVAYTRSVCCCEGQAVSVLPGHTQVSSEAGCTAGHKQGAPNLVVPVHAWLWPLRSGLMHDQEAAVP